MSVQEPSLVDRHARPAPPQAEHLAQLQELILHAAHLLPAQGPITSFVHHNTLHAFEHLPFHEAVKQGARIFGCQPYLSEEEYRRLLEGDRITMADLEQVLLEGLGDYADGLIGRVGTRYHLQLAMLQYPLRTAPGHELRWLIAESDALSRFRPETPALLKRRMIERTRHWVMRDWAAHRHVATVRDPALDEALKGLIDREGTSRMEHWSQAAWESLCLRLLWQICCHGVRRVAHAPDPPQQAVRHRDLLLSASGEDSDRFVHETLVRFCSAYLDQGMAHVPLPVRERGFFQAFVAIYRRRGSPPDRWMSGLREELQRLFEAGTAPLESIAESLDVLGVDREQQQQFIAETLLALRGWGGMLWQTEVRPDRVAHPSPDGTLIGFLAVRLLLERFALAYVARETLGYRGPLAELRAAVARHIPPRRPASVEHRAFLVFQLAQVLGWTPQDLYQFSKAEWGALVREIESFTPLERRRLFQEAYERRFNSALLSAVAAHSRRAVPQPSRPRFQLVCCIDDREESFRRHVEEVAPDAETFGFAGFFAVAMYYRGAADAHYLPLCPVVIQPQHYVCEEVAYTFEQSHRRRANARRRLGTWSHLLHLGSRTIVGGMLTTLLGALASIPLVARVLCPRLTARIRRLLGRFVQTPPVTQLRLERTETEPGPDGGHVGYTVDEMAAIVERVLRDIGMTQRLARLVLITGHGSSSLNNPHESAYNCGACAGGRGGPNARAFSHMANDPRVRDRLAKNGLPIPQTTVFVGAYHNTCDESMTYYDLDRLPSSHWHDFEYARRCIDEARRRNAHERCRRFESASLALAPQEALRHVESRAEDLSQARPEYNHATNAVTVVGRRARTRGLFLDRRAFLTSYDPETDDPEHNILLRILQPAVPVCAGISLEYYFSCVDPEGWGCSSKLPHNITSLLGVMLGAASDLKPGLSRQMIEIHEPMRPLFVVETTPQAMLDLMQRNGDIGRLCTNGWVHLATLDPHSSQIHIFRSGTFQPFSPATAQLSVAPSSQDWYRGWRDNLGFASILPSGSNGAGRTPPGHLAGGIRR